MYNTFNLIRNPNSILVYNRQEISFGRFGEVFLLTWIFHPRGEGCLIWVGESVGFGTVVMNSISGVTALVLHCNNPGGKWPVL